MKHLRLVFALLASAGATLAVHAQGFAPANFGNVVFNGTIASSTGGVNGTGTLSDIFTITGKDYSVSVTGEALLDAANYSYAKTADNTATITETNLSIALTFTSATQGSFIATYSPGATKTQTGTFVLTPIPFASPLANMSTRCIVPANGTAITGVVIAGTGPRRVLIRAVGPGLTSFGVPSVLANPTLQIWSGTTVVTSNDDWSANATEATALKAAYGQAGAFSLADGSKDSAVILTLQPGAYTAAIRGAAGEGGEVLAEVYYLN